MRVLVVSKSLCGYVSNQVEYISISIYINISQYLYIYIYINQYQYIYIYAQTYIYIYIYKTLKQTKFIHVKNKNEQQTGFGPPWSQLN